MSSETHTTSVTRSEEMRAVPYSASTGPRVRDLPSPSLSAKPASRSPRAARFGGFDLSGPLLVPVMAVGPIAGVSDLDPFPMFDVPVSLASDFNVAAQFTAGYCRSLYVGTTGTVIAQLSGNASPTTYVGVPAGSVLPGKFTLVKSTSNGTTASNIVARW